MNPNTNQLWNTGKPAHRDHVMFVITTLNQSEYIQILYNKLLFTIF